MTPPRFVAAGNAMAAEVAGIGWLQNPLIAL